MARATNQPCGKRYQQRHEPDAAPSKRSGPATLRDLLMHTPKVRHVCIVVLIRVIPSEILIWVHHCTGPPIR